MSGKQLALDLGDLVLEQQLSLFQPLQLQLIDRSARGETRDHLVEVAVFGFQRGELCFQCFDVEVHGPCLENSVYYSTPEARGTIRPGGILLRSFSPPAKPIHLPFTAL